MAVPPQYSSYNYIKDSLELLQNYSWIYNYPNTHILALNVFEKIPAEWVQYLEHCGLDNIKNLGLGKTEVEAPSSLKNFVDDISRLLPITEPFKSVKTSDKIEKNCKLSKKKFHEIQLLSPVIHKLCSEENICNIIDVGTGLGYLAQDLHSKYSLKVLGIEGSKEKFKLAVNMQEQYYNCSKPFVKYEEHFITESSGQALDKSIRSYFPNDAKTCVVGLHACADLSVTILKLFLEIEQVKCLALMPCCYHRLELKFSNSCNEAFINFPCSQIFKQIFDSLNGSSFLRIPFLRLACQQSKSCWLNLTLEEHVLHAKNCLYRAVLQLAIEKENMEMSRLKRKTGKSKQNYETYCFEDYIETLAASYEIKSRDDMKHINLDIFREKLLQYWDVYKDKLLLVEGFTALQSLIQPLCENLILLDRIEFLKENSIDANVVRVTDDTISPRCFAIIARKH